ncbi:MAG: hypothetical protein IJW49_04860 [Clostridia bacterium]|nr:hypothetical protein [Clostridia bacterium]
MDLQNKKLLVLGGTSYYPYIRDYANKKGFVIYSAGKSDNEMIRTYSDKFFCADAIDVDAISALVEREEIHGIAALGNEDIIDRVIDVSKRCKIPFYIERGHWENLQNKQNFKRHCREFGIDVVEEYSVTEQSTDAELQALPYPIVLKPTDSCGSKGITVCKDASEVRAAMEKAKSFSRGKHFIAEQYMVRPEFIVTLMIKDGNIQVWMLGDRHMNTQQEGFGGISQISVFPSRYSDLYMNTVHPKMLKLLDKYGPENGTFFVQAFIDGDKIRCFDPGLRFCGTLDTILYEPIMGINPLHWMINHSLTGVMDDADEMSKMDFMLDNKVAAQLSLHIQTGTIAKIRGLNRIEKLDSVICMVPLLEEGDTVNMAGTLQQVLARVYFVADSREDIERMAHEFYDMVSVTGTDGRELLMPFVLDYEI